MLSKVVLAVTVVVVMATSPMEETTTLVTTAEMEALLWATMAMAVMEALQLVVSLSSVCTKNLLSIAYPDPELLCLLRKVMQFATIQA